jgi:hypothetical protein
VAAAALPKPDFNVTIPGTETKDADGNDIPGKIIPMPDSVKKLYGYKSSNPKSVLDALVADYGMDGVINMLKENIDGDSTDEL